MQPTLPETNDSSGKLILSMYVEAGVRVSIRTR